MARSQLTLAARFTRHVQRGAPDECWLWTGCLNINGYGSLFNGRRRGHGKRGVLAHRVAWELAFGACPRTLDVCHRCDVPACVNPAHLFLGTARDNVADMVSKGRDGFTGERNPHARLTDDQVREIRTSTEPGRVIAKRLGVSCPTISEVRRRKLWKHVAAVAAETVADATRYQQRTRLTDDQVREIRGSSERVGLLAKRFSVTSGTIHKGRRGQRRQHVR
jgi:hypothetical protein